MRLLRPLFAACLILTLGSADLSAATKEVKPGTKLWGKPFLKSALLPGWGQWSEGHRGRAAIVLGAFAASAAWCGLMIGAENSSYNEYKLAKSPEAATAAWNNNRNQATLLIISEYLTGAIYVGQLGEAIYSAPRTPMPAPLAAPQGGRPMRLELASLEWSF